MASDPSTISDLDDNDEDELQASDANAGALMAPNNMIHFGMLLSLLHQVCSAYEKDSDKRDRMFQLVCQQMSKMQLLPAQGIIDTFSSMQASYTQAFRQMMHATLQLLQEEAMEPRLLSLPATEQERTAVLLQMQIPLLRQPIITPEEVFCACTTRYQNEFEELCVLGKGGFGKVYKVCSRLDQRNYAIKKIKLKQANVDKSYKLVKEVQLLASLKHRNVVGYNTSWIEAEPMNSNNTYPGAKRQEPVTSLKCLPPSSSESPRSSSEQESSTTDKNKVKVKDLGNKGECSPGIWENNANVSPLCSTCPAQTDYLSRSPSRLSRSPSDSTSTLVNSPSTPKAYSLLDVPSEDYGSQDEQSPDFKPTNQDKTFSQEAVTSTATSASSYHRTINHRTIDHRSSITTTSAEESKTVRTKTHIQKDLFQQNSLSQSISTGHESYQYESKTTAVHSYGYEQDSLSESDIKFHNSESTSVDLVDDEYSDIQICFENSYGDDRNDMDANRVDIPFDEVEDNHLSSDEELSDSIRGTSKDASTAVSNLLMQQNKNTWRFPKDMVHGSFGSVLPRTHLPRSTLQPIKIKSKCEIVSLDDPPNNRTKEQASKPQRRRHRSKSQDGIETKPKLGSGTPNMIPSVQTFPTFSLVLYIQMQLCSHTLSDWLRDRNMKTGQAKHTLDVVNTYDNMHIFKQILDGIHYIHSQGLIHRDLKPKNIFLEESTTGPQVLIGDFGLAKEDILLENVQPETVPPDQSPDYHHRVWAKSCEPTSHTAAVGTTTYASPEQLKGTKYDCKSDMYSSGIILFEMFHPFVTQMERAKVMGQVRQGNIPQELCERWPEQYKTIGQLTHTNSCHRPLAAEVLKGPLFLSKDEIIKDLRAQLSRKDAEIQELKQTIAKFGKTSS